VSAAGGYAWPRCADADGDGDLDMYVGTGDGLVELWINSGVFRSRGPVTVAGKPIRTAGPALVAPTDYDQDGDVDLFVGSKPAASSRSGALPAYAVAYFENASDRPNSLPVFNKGTPIGIEIQLGEEQATMDGAVLGPQLVEPLKTATDGATRFLVTTDLGLFLFTSNRPRGRYPFLHIRSSGQRLPPAVAPAGYSVYACDFCGTGRPALICGLDEYGMVIICADWLP